MDKEYIEEPNYEYDTVVFDSNSLKILKEQNEYTQDEIQTNIANIFPDYWISDNRIDITYIFNDIKEKSYISQFVDNCELDEFYDFMDYVNNTQMNSYYDWEKYDLNIFVNKYTYRKNPTLKQYMSHYLIELYDLFSYLTRNYVLKFGTFEVFVEFVYLTSSNNTILK